MAVGTAGPPPGTGWAAAGRPELLGSCRQHYAEVVSRRCGPVCRRGAHVTVDDPRTLARRHQHLLHRAGLPRGSCWKPLSFGVLHTPPAVVCDRPRSVCVHLCLTRACWQAPCRCRAIVRRADRAEHVLRSDAAIVENHGVLLRAPGRPEQVVKRLVARCAASPPARALAACRTHTDHARARVGRRSCWRARRWRKQRSSRSSGAAGAARRSSSGGAERLRKRSSSGAGGAAAG